MQATSAIAQMDQRHDVAAAGVHKRLQIGAPGGGTFLHQTNRHSQPACGGTVRAVGRRSVTAPRRYAASQTAVANSRNLLA